MTEELVELGAQILALKKKLGEPCDGSIAERICWYCREWGSTARSDKAAGQMLATRFLDEIDHGGSRKQNS